MTDLSHVAQQVYAHCQQLASFSQASDNMDRRYLTPQHQQANEQVAQWMQQAGMNTWQDAVGNQWGRFASSTSNAPTLIIGSHLDTVPNGGKYDGILGVLLPLGLLLHCFEHNINFPFHIDLVGFGDEEGTRFGSTLLGSRGVTGNWDAEWANLTDADNISLPDALQAFGLDFAEVGAAARTQEDLLAFLEVHIEQGPVLENENLPVGVVTSIAGAKRFNLTVTGKAGHAGTVPMPMRQDALVAASEMIIAISDIAAEHQIVATSGFIENKPNAVNVISQTTQFSIDIRAENDSDRDQALEAIETRLAEIATQRNVSLMWENTHSAPAVHCAPELQDLFTKAVENCGIRPLKLLSGAGHDAMEMAKLCPMAMLFTRCAGGISHHPGESVEVEDIEATLQVLYSSLQLLSQQSLSQQSNSPEQLQAQTQAQNKEPNQPEALL